VSPVFSHGDLRLYLLNLLDEAPRHGYDIIQALSDRTGGTYTPSAGTVYPRLAKLEEEGLVTKSIDGRKTVYEITEAGRAEVASRAGDLEGIEAGLTDSVRLIADEVRGSRSRGDEEPACRPGSVGTRGTSRRYRTLAIG
jgi:DNA-binding PadR family transcriptional regulator